MFQAPDETDRGAQGFYFIFLSDGVGYRSKTPLGTAIEYAQRANTIIYSILFAEPCGLTGHFAQQFLRGTARGMDVMLRLAAEAGGACFEVTKNQPIGIIYSQIEDTLRNQYSIGYTRTTGGDWAVTRSSWPLGSSA